MSTTHPTDPPSESDLHVIVGAGAVGAATARRLAREGRRVRVVTRSGSAGTDCPGEHHAVDASDPEALIRVSRGAVAIYNCANPPYHRWAADWPPLAASLLATAESTGAVLVTMSNLYGYSDPGEPLTEESPRQPSSRKGRIRAAMWDDALAAHRAGRVRATEARASDFLGAEVGANAHMGDRVVPRVLRGRPVSVLGDPTQLHSWTAVEDTARTLAILGTDERAWGRAWHVPTAPPVTATDLIGRLAVLAGREPVKVRSVPRLVFSVARLLSRDLRELEEMFYQFERPFVIDSSAFTKEFGVDPTALDDTLEAVIAHYRTR
ncbi:MAG: NAD-dependent epimerase/dehydratase family protein [Acidimicrobiales bacterium]